MTTPPGEHPATAEAMSTPPAAVPARKGPPAATWNAVSAALGAVMGLAPHVLHHVGLIAGAALVTGAGGNLLFFALGVVFSIPLLRRLFRRFHTWKAPAFALVVFAAMFSLSAFVLGPALTGPSAPNPAPAPGPSSVPTTTVPADHGEHHSG
ncbi:hypothetical protein RAJCM14343_1810 [Rhodococcus aetherivorans]|uniref:Uncharacterized protein n=1 Tax=Rhodococcus aetherivorans TaxID=191292 RepID=A0ABQ0YJ36_9NOCA|nr:hypothetical protein [Rhodococcus aetherivorans]ETT23597.1 hypothetical protein RR21198_5359 [Rhodococcus rhodochrous ATCC 21198]KDE10740.1 hypothetical protein N505_0121125 [Rhodococcus aetherivorans]NGP27097.1 hypothetical protein [Rhodococcus aetherivorans]GES36558.1 hypothetical protein RAJCM14343_1810 [Rhodococcus aetherivorans]